MVDFQQRDTQRGADDDAEQTRQAEESAETDDDHHHHETDHDHHDHDADSVAAAVVTVSSSRTLDTDPAGDAAAELLEDAGHDVALRELVDDDHDRVQRTVDRAAAREDVDFVVTAGGTGVTPDDVTPDAVEPLLDKDLPGFGELFRALSREEVGSRVVGTRATAGIAEDVPVFCLPGSENAARLGVGEVVVPEVEHLVGLARREE
jgi:molybdenum cofactor biosynthesis protein B